MAFPVGWNYFCPIQINSAQVTGDLTNFPILINGLYNLPFHLWSVVKAAGEDVRFTSDSAGANGLHYEISHISVANAQALIWVNVPSLSTSVNTVIYVWYGNSSATAPTATDSTFGSQGVWNANYRGVWHLNQATAANCLDSTSYGNTLLEYNSPTLSGTPFPGASTASGGLLFNGTNQYVAGATGLSAGTTHTSECWMNSTRTVNTTINGYYIGIGTTSSYDILGYMGTYGTANQFVFIDRLTGIYGGSVLSTSTWYHSAVVRTSATSATGWLNGAANTTVDSNSSTPAGTGVWIGVRPDGNWFFQGYMAELRVSSVGLTSDWLATQYHNQSAPGTFAWCGMPNQALVKSFCFFS